MDTSKNNSKVFLFSALAALGLLACYWVLQPFFVDLDQKLTKHQRFELAQDFHLPVLKRLGSVLAPGKTEMVLQDARGKNILLHFWASWCAVCRDEKPFLQELIDRHQDGSLEVIGVASYDSLAALQSSGLLAEAPFTVLLDDGGAAALAYKVPALPQSVLIDGEGQIRYRVKGALTHADIASLEATLLTIKQERQSAAAAAPVLGGRG